ncbi:hypothetical protein C0J52_03635 [Blattella germanica]|nr:hypothetical protein C0J52_03635 [Blattella germanica]
MARLDKLLIQGIRSFGPEEADKQHIRFQSPITLILGQNGCGKTTIIECLKYVLIGELPPGARLGHSFIHDPKMTNKVEDESTWPMDESKKVKERFDSIFDATKYNKYIDNMKSRRKSYADEEVTSKNKQLEEAKVRMTVNRDQLDGFDKKLEPINERMQKIMSIEGNYTKLYTEKEKKKTELAGVMSSQRELISGIKNRFSGSTEELEEAIQMFQVEMKEKENSFDELNAKLRRLREDDMKLQNEITRAKVEKGKLQAQQKLQDERIDARNKQLRELAAELEIQVFIYCRDEKVSLEQQVTMKSKQIQETRNEAKKIKNEIEEVKLSATKLQRIEDRLKRTVRDLEDVEKSVNVEELQNSIDIKLDQCNSLSEQLEDVDREVKMLQQQSSIQAELDIQRDSKSTKETEIRKLKNKHEDTLKDLLKDVPEEGIKYELKLCIDRLDQKGTLSSSEYMFKGYIQKLQNQNPCCPLCHRGFDLASDVQELVRELNTKIREVPSLLRENTTKLDIEQRKYKTLLELKPTYEDITTLNTTEIPRLRNELKQTEEKLGALRREVENLEFGLALPQADKDRAERIQPDIVLLDQHHKELKKLEQEIERLEAKLPPGCIGVQQRKQLEEKYADLQATEFVLVEEIESLRENLGTSKRQFEAAVKEKETQKIQNKDKLRKEQKKIRKRDLEDNLKLRKKEEDAEKLKKAIEKLQNSLGDLNLDNILKEKKDLIKQEESINREKAHTEGMLKEQQSTILTLRADLAKPLYKDNEKNYLEKVVDKEILESLINDILIYQKAVEKAAIQFHQEKMSEINRTTRELWRQIYRGNDIDYIEIKTDIPETGGDKRRNYNYRLVLASLIVRLALAQTFCSDCGVLALDEPTTNLDKENVESLSTALAELISSKFVQQNFQLIIITHDEEFLERLSKVEKMKYYYRVSRNDKGLSVIEKLRVDL